MRNPYMKFQNCILINFVTQAWMDGRTDKPIAICPFNFSKVGGIKIMWIFKRTNSKSRHLWKFFMTNFFKPNSLDPDEARSFHSPLFSKVINRQQNPPLTGKEFRRIYIPNLFLTLCMLFWCLLIFFNITFFKILFQENSLDPDQARHFVGPDLDPNCLQSLSAVDKLCR